MTASIVNEHASDAELWQRVRGGDRAAFEVLVRRHQSAVSAVAYNACGDLALSEDVAQETFWAAWQQRSALQDPGRLRGWLCGIARNLGKNARRRAARTGATASGDADVDVPAVTPGPVEEAVSREEGALLWETIEHIPAAYREPLILYYREEQSVAEVAAALELSPEAVRQRLSRGRAMLQERVTQLVEGALRRSRPGRAFTAGVMAGLAALGTSAKSALAGTAAGAGKAVVSGVVSGTVKGAVGGVSGGVVGGILGPVLGVFGSWLGTWLPAQLAPSRAEHEYLLRASRRTLVVSLAFTALLIGPVLLMAGRVGPQYLWGYLGIWMVALNSYIVVEVVRHVRASRRFRRDPNAAPNEAPLRQGLVAVAARHRGRVYRSRARLFGLPLLDVNVSDPAPSRQGEAPPRRVARGWIAIGDEAHGVLLAVGHVAWGLVALGGRAVGGVCFGGVAAGVVAFGGLSLGVVSVGGLSAGVLAMGGLAVGWQAYGGGAIGAEVAYGGGAAAWHLAYGGAALAHDYAVGGGAWAEHANDDAARAALGEYAASAGVAWYEANVAWVVPVYLLVILLLSFLPMLLMYRRERTG